MEQGTLLVDEFTAGGELRPCGAIEWRSGSDYPTGFQAVGSVGDGQEDAVAAEVFQEMDTGRVLVHLVYLNPPKF